MNVHQGHSIDTDKDTDTDTDTDKNKGMGMGMGMDMDTDTDVVKCIYQRNIFQCKIHLIKFREIYISQNWFR